MKAMGLAAVQPSTVGDCAKQATRVATAHDALGWVAGGPNAGYKALTRRVRAAGSYTHPTLPPNSEVFITAFDRSDNHY